MPDEEIPPGTDLEGGAGGQHDPAPEWRPPASQEELDRLINKATAKVHGKYKDYDSVRERAGLYDQLLAQTQTDSERAAAEAEERAYNAAMGSVVPRLVKAEFRAAAKGVLEDGQLDALIEDVDLTKYVADDGEPDLDKIGRKIKAVAPKAPPPPSFGQGNRGTAPSTTNMNDFIRKQAGLLPG
jgi:hypothetical protein